MTRIDRNRMTELAQAQLEAYNARDIEAFCKCYHPQVQAVSLPDQKVIVEGLENFKELYEKMFADSPQLNCELRSRTVLNDSVLDEEWVTGRLGSSTPSHVVAIYFFKDNLIFKIFFTR